MTIRLCVCVWICHIGRLPSKLIQTLHMCVSVRVCMCEDQWQPLEQGMAEMELSAVMEDRK